MNTTVWIILTAALATYATRIGGHLILSRFKRIHPKVEAGLNAVPAAVLTSLFAPAAANAGLPEAAALVVAALVSLRAGISLVLIAGATTLILLRYLVG